MIFLSGRLYADNFVEIPHVNRKAQNSFQFDYSYAAQHRAFAIAPGGGWSWTSSKASKEDAKKTALQGCDKYSKQKCVLYAVDNEVVFDKENWPTLWSPYKNKKQAKVSEIGVSPFSRYGIY